MIWNLPPQHVDVSRTLLGVAGSELIAGFLHRRGITDPAQARAFLNPDAYTPTDPLTMPDVDRGVDRLQRALRNGERICVWGDFDVDGQTSTTLLVTALRRLGGDVIYHIPVREKESHGIRPDVLGTFLQKDIQILLTCDTGIAAVEAVNKANVAGVDVIITDHHDLPEYLPDAYARINPKFLDTGHPLGTLPGVGVAYKLIEALYQRQDLTHELESFLDLVALGIVADIALLQKDTRYLLQKGLSVLTHSHRAGILALKKNAGIEGTAFIEEDIGFRIGPRLNAVGRLADANITVPLLSTTDEEEAARIADRLERLNEDRKLLTDQVYQAALVQIDRHPSLLQYAALVLAHPTWHQGVIGIVASRLVERYGKPTILLTCAEGKAARGSARSIEGYHITRAIATQQHLLHGFGGHPMAAGLSMNGDEETIERFRRGVSAGIIAQRSGQEIKPAIEIDAEFDLRDLTLELAAELERLAPFGPGNPPLNLLVKGVFVKEANTIGQGGKHRKLTVIDRTNTTREVLWWNGSEERLPTDSIDLVLRIRPATFLGERSASLTWIACRPAGGQRIEVRTKHRIQVEDLRMVEPPQQTLQVVLDKETSIQVWSEILKVPATKTWRRDELTGADALVIWTSPPSQRVLNTVLKVVRPERVYVVALDPEIDDTMVFMRRLLGFIKYALREHDGRIPLTKLAALLGHDENTVLAALTVSQQYGIRADVEAEGWIQFTASNVHENPEDDSLLKALLAETKAFRDLFRTTRRLEGFL